MNIFGINFTCMDKTKTSDWIRESLVGNSAKSVVKYNTELLLRALKGGKFRDTISVFDLTIVDGRGVQWAARCLTLPVTNNRLFRPVQAIWQMIYSGVAIVFNPRFLTYPIPEVIPGVEALELMLGEAEEAGVGVFFFGSPEEVQLKAIDNLKKKFPGLKVSGHLNGFDYQQDKNTDPVAVINKTEAKLLIVSLGSPKQEYWIHENLDKLNNVKVAVGEGGTLDRVANPSQKAPKWLNRIGMEWLWRLLFNKSQTETRNRFQRFWNSVPVFIYEVVKYKIANGETKIED